MAGAFTTNSLRWAVLRLKERMALSAGELNELDGALGDGDLGVNLMRAIERLAEDLPNLPDDVGMALLRCAQAFTRVSASTYGTLLATGLMSAAKTVKGRTEAPWADVPALLGGALQAMSARGKGELGDKTVLDAVEAARRATAGLDDPAAMAGESARAIADAIIQLRDLPFRQGRARIFGSKGIGRDDPGMVAFKRIVESLGSPPTS
ncbi:MAG: dihydroxyacetone kinase subunit L [Bryobacteraceae bacterium]|jgi:dihydroxyacetone kinase-like protein